MAVAGFHSAVLDCGRMWRGLSGQGSTDVAGPEPSSKLMALLFSGSQLDDALQCLYSWSTCHNGCHTVVHQCQQVVLRLSNTDVSCVLQDRVEGAALLEAAELRGDDSDAELGSDADSDDLELGSEIELGSEVDVDSADEAEAESDAEAEAMLAAPPGSKADGADGNTVAQQQEKSDGSDQLDSLAQDSGAELASSSDEEADTAQIDSAAESDSGGESASEAEPEQDAAGPSGRSDSEDEDSEAKDLDQDPKQPSKPKLQPDADSLQTLKKKLAAAKGAQGGATGAEEESVPIEWGRVLTAEDFERIKQLRHRSDRLRS